MYLCLPAQSPAYISTFGITQGAYGIWRNLISFGELWGVVGESEKYLQESGHLRLVVKSVEDSLKSTSLLSPITAPVEW